VLILNRKEGEKVIIGKDIVVKILKIKTGSVSIAFSAPSEITIHREEIKEQIDQQKVSSPG